MKKAIGYIRVSTNQQDLERQKVLITEWCSINNYNLVKVLEDKLSGAIAERKGYLELLSTTKEDTDIIIVAELSRLSRQADIMNTLTAINDILQNGIDILFLDNEKLYKGGTELELIDIITIAVEAKQAAEERKKIVHRMNSGRKVKFAQFDNMCIGKVPFGYERIPNPEYIRSQTPRSILVRNENADIIKDMYKWILEGKKLKDIAQILQSRGIKTMSGKDFDTNSVMNIIHSPIYKGVWKFSGQTKKGDAIVSPEIWDKTQIALKNNRIREITKGVNYNPLKGILKCPCGRGMYIVHNYKYYQYRCAIKKNKYDETICNNGGIDMNIVIPAAWHCIKNTINSREYNIQTNIEVQNLNKEISEKDITINETINRIDEIKAKQNQTAINMANITNANILAVMEEEYNKLEKEVKIHINNLEEIKKEKIRLINLKENLERKDIEKELDNISIEEKSKLFQRYIEKIVYYSEVMHRGFLVVTFKNGTEIPFLVLARKNVVCSPLITFGFNVDERKVTLEVYPERKGLDFNLVPEIRMYNTYEVENLFTDIVKERNIFGKFEIPDFE